MFAWLRRCLERKRTAQNLYGSIVAQARHEPFYTDYGVPDTLEGRFELLVIHVFIMLEGLRRSDGSEHELARHLVDMFIADMDATMRELGVGDVTVPKKIRVLAEVFFDRLRAYRAAVGDGGQNAIKPLLERHVYGALATQSDLAQALASYMVRTIGQVKRTPLEELLDKGFDGVPAALGRHDATGP